MALFKHLPENTGETLHEVKIDRPSANDITDPECSAEEGAVKKATADAATRPTGEIRARTGGGLGMLDRRFMAADYIAPGCG